MTEEDTFNKLVRADFDEIVTLMISQDTPEYRAWFIHDVASDPRIRPVEETWEKIGYGWTWFDFVKECRKRLNDDKEPF